MSPKLTELCLRRLVHLLHFHQINKYEIRRLPDNLLMDVYFTMYESNRLCRLAIEFSDLRLFDRVLQIYQKRIELCQIFASLVNHGCSMPEELFITYKQLVQKPGNDVISIDMGYRIGAFLNETGCLNESDKFLSFVLDLCRNSNQFHKAFECCLKLLQVRLRFGLFSKATETYMTAEELLATLKWDYHNLTSVYTVFSDYYAAFGFYDKALDYTKKSLKSMNKDTSVITVIDALRNGTKTFTQNQQVNKASILIRHAVYLATEHLPELSPKYAEVLMDYGLSLVNSDSMNESDNVYQKCLQIRNKLFGETNYLVGMTYKSYSYCIYVKEYLSSRFTRSEELVEKAIEILTQTSGDNSYATILAKRIKALILEEDAIERSHLTFGVPTSPYAISLLDEAEQLHLASLKFAISMFGEESIHSAKHYGNLGRLYQSMHKFEESEKMHLKAISIKERLLGSYDSDVGLSIGYLASLYTYHMKKYDKAISLYKRSIEITLKTFGDTFSGLQYDYQGLMHVYKKLKNLPEMEFYRQKLDEWTNLRQLRDAIKDLYSIKSQSLEELIKEL